MYNNMRVANPKSTEKCFKNNTNAHCEKTVRDIRKIIMDSFSTDLNWATQQKTNISLERLFKKIIEQQNLSSST